MEADAVEEAHQVWQRAWWLLHGELGRYPLDWLRVRELDQHVLLCELEYRSAAHMDTAPVLLRMHCTDWRQHAGDLCRTCGTTLGMDRR